ncbi:MAG: Mut7-C RNAse domain-containing protein [Flavisolibacter sp.]
MEVPRFLADVHLGKLARSLRLLGFDTAYQNNYSYTELLHLAVEDHRVLLSRNAAFAKTVASFFQVEGEDPMNQLHQVVDHFQLKESIHPFSRCLACNGKIELVKKEEIDNRLEPDTRKFYEKFWRCESCGKIYWKGSHYERMVEKFMVYGL